MKTERRKSSVCHYGIIRQILGRDVHCASSDYAACRAVLRKAGNWRAVCKDRWGKRAFIRCIIAFHRQNKQEYHEVVSALLNRPGWWYALRRFSAIL